MWEESMVRGMARSGPFVIGVVILLIAVGQAAPDVSEHPDIVLFVEAASPDERVAKAALEQIASAWRDGYTAMFVDIARLLRPDRPTGAATAPAAAGGPDDLPGADQPGGASFGSAPAGAAAGSPVRRRLIRFVERQTGESFGDDLDRWRRWLWSRPYDPHPEYAMFKGRVLGQIDPRFEDLLPAGVETTVRLDQVDWGGVPVDGIPLLDHPTHLSADEARYLKDKHVVFGLVVNGEARAYPKRVLAWHELARDTLGGEELAIVYCTLCGAVIPYRTESGGTSYHFRTSGLLYRSNKLMFDEETRSLWSTVYGRPVVGPLAGSGQQLDRLPVVTTTWGEWRAAHPETTVLSVETGYERDYREGAAYRDYFRSDRLMFAVPESDGRLKNKAEVLVVSSDHPLAIATRFLEKNPLFELEHAGTRYVVVTTSGGANRVYETDGVSFVERVDDSRIVDSAGRTWLIGEEALTEVGGELPDAPRVAAHRTFWFAWHAHYPETVLIR